MVSNQFNILHFGLIQNQLSTNDIITSSKVAHQTWMYYKLNLETANNSKTSLDILVDEQNDKQIWNIHNDF